MNNGLKKTIALVSILSIILSSAPMVMAEDIYTEDVAINTDAVDNIFSVAEDETIIGSCDFNDSFGWDGDRFLQSNVVTYYEVNEFVQLENGARKDGANGNTGFYQTSTDSSTHGKNVTANLGQYVTSDRGPKINLTVDPSLTEGKRVVTRFEYKPTNGTPNKADLILRDTETGLDVAQLVVGVDLVENEWNNIEIATETDGTTIIIVNDVVRATTSMTPSKYPQIRFTEEASDKDKQSLGCVDNIVLAIGGQLTDEDLLSMALNELVIDTTQQGIDAGTEKDSYIVTEKFNLPANPQDTTVEWKAYQKAKGSSEEWSESSILTVKGSEVNVAYTEDMANYDYKLTAYATYGTASGEKEINITLKTPQEVIDAVKSTTVLIDKATSEELKPNKDNIYEVNADLLLDKGSQVTITWSCKDEEGNSSELITSDGVIMPTDDTTKHTLVANYSFQGVTDTKEFSVVLPNAVTTYIDPVIEELKFKSADDSEVEYDANNIGTVKNDIELPTSINVADGKVVINWVSNNENGIITDKSSSSKVLQVFMQDYGTQNMSLTGEFTYVKNDKELVSKTPDSYDFTVEFTKEDMESDNALMDKYRVRFDEAYEDNFEDIPTTISSDITLPNKGYFGSTISWTSSAPTILSSTGVFVRPSSTRTITLTATIMSGKEQVTKNFSITAQGKSSGSSGGSGGGGSTSSTGTSSSTGGGSTISNSTSRPVTDNTITSGSDKVDALIQEKEEAENRFSDIGGVSWARDAINGLADAGIINGKTDTEFAPNDNVTRAEFAKILMGVFGLTSEAFTTSSFSDVPTDAWYFNYVETAYNLGIINGVEDGVFAPNANITRQDMCVMVVRAAEVSGKSISAVNEAKVFADEASIADYAKSAVTTLQTGGIVDGVSDTVFAPLDNATRAQAAKILYSFL